MKIVNFTRGLRNTKHGGEGLSVETLTKLLKNKGHDVLTISLEKKSYKEDGFIGLTRKTKPILPKLDTFIDFAELNLSYRKQLIETISDYNPDLMIYRKDWSYVGCYIGKKLGVSTILKLYDYEFYYGRLPNGWNPRFNILLHIPFPCYKNICRYVLNNSSMVLGNSERTANLYRRISTNREIYGIPSFIDISNIKPFKKLGNEIVHITPSKNKGIDITLDVADLMPEYNFKIVGQSKGWNFQETKERMKEQSNVEYLGFAPNLKEIYKNTFVVLMPSLDEGYGRIPIEAGAYGIPVITSGLAGLAESSVPSLTVDKNEAIYYKEKIKEVENNIKHYRELSIDNAKNKCSDFSFKRLSEVVWTSLGLKL